MRLWRARRLRAEGRGRRRPPLHRRATDVLPCRQYRRRAQPGDPPGDNDPLPAVSGRAVADRGRRKLCPAVDRDRARGGYPRRSVAGAGGRLIRTKQQAVLKFRWPIDLALTVASHGWVYLAPWRWDPESGQLARAEQIGDRLGRIEVAQHGADAVTIGWEGFGADEASEVLERVRRWLSADWEPASAIAALPDVAQLIERGGGRMLRGSSFYEDFV